MDEEWAGFVNFRQRRLKLLIDKKIPCFLVDALIEHYIAKSSPHGPRTADRPKSTQFGHRTPPHCNGSFRGTAVIHSFESVGKSSTITVTPYHARNEQNYVKATCQTSTPHRQRLR